MDRRRRRRRRRLLLALLVLAALLLWCGRRPGLVVGTFNIRMFPEQKTDPDAVAAAIAELDADVFAVQEIVDPAAFERVLRQASALTGRSYVATLARSYCPKRDGRMHVGVVHDARRLERIGSRPFADDRNGCQPGQPSGMIAAFQAADERRIALVSVHFTALDELRHRAERERQWRWLVAALPSLAAEFSAPVVVAGDFNSTGFLKPDDSERRFIDTIVADHGLRLPTAALDCSMYWKPKGREDYAVSLLDHVLIPGELTATSTEVLGMCAALECAPQSKAPEAFTTVSDHCPVRTTLKL